MRQPRDEARPGLVEVELVEVEAESPLGVIAAEHYRQFHGGAFADEVPDGAAEVVGMDGPSPSERRGAGVALRLLGIGIVLALVAVTVAANVLVSRREAERQARLGQHSWILPAMEGPLQDVWQVDAPQIIAEVMGVVVTSEVPGTGDVTAIDTATGRELWTRTGSEAPETCAGVREGADDGRSTGVISPEYLVCAPQVDYMRDRRPPEPGYVAPIMVLDPATGDVVGRVEVEGTPLAWDVVDGDLLVTFVTHHAAVGILRWDVQRSRQEWAFESVPGLMPNGLYGEWGYALLDDAVRVTSDDTTVAVSVESGEQLDPAEVADPAADLQRVVLPDGGVAEWSEGPIGAGATGRVVEPDGSTRFEFAGVPWRAWRSDGSAPEILVVQRGGSAGLVGLDAVTGEELWSRVGSQRAWPVVQIGGLVVAVAGESAMAIDLDDGDVRWRAQIAPTPGPAVVTDGEVVLLPVRDGFAASLVALDLTSGLELWRIPVRSGVVELHPAMDGTVLLLTANRIIAYR